jgi:hypothetical protein
VRKLSQYYIEIYAPPYPHKGYCIKVHRGSYNSDSLSPDLVQLIKTNGYDKEDAISQFVIYGGMRVL